MSEPESQATVPATAPAKTPAVIRALLQQAEANPDRIALRDAGARISYGVLVERVRNLAGELQRRELIAGDRLLIWANKSNATVAIMLAGLYLGLVIVPVAPALRPVQAERIFHRSRARGIVIDNIHRQWLTNDVTAPKDASYWFAQDFGGPFSTLDTTAAISATDAPTPRQGDDLAALFFTSGSTGQSKGVMVTHDNLAIGAASVADYLRLQAHDCLLGMLPLSFDYGFSQLTTAFHVGACLHLADYLLPGDFKRPLLEDGITVVAGTPGLLIPLSRQRWLAEAPALRLITNSGGHLPVAAVQAFRSARPQTKLFLMYGLTEAFRASYLPPDEVDMHPDSMGRAFAASRLGLVDEDGRLLGPGSTGELIQGGPLVTAGYFDDPEATAERFRAPPADWPYLDERVVYSGDRVHMDEDGRLYFRGRLDDQIKTAGFRVSPEEIESVALASPGVHEALAYAIPDVTLGARIGLAVAPESVDEAQLRQRLKEQLAPYQQPVCIQRHPALPRSANGKLDRKALMANHEKSAEQEIRT